MDVEECMKDEMKLILGNPYQHKELIEKVSNLNTHPQNSK